MATIGQKLSKGNYFKEALEIRGNRRLLLNTLLELKLSGLNASSIKALKLGNKEKATGLIELYTLFLDSTKDDFYYPDLVLELKARILAGKYDKIFPMLKMSFLTEVGTVGSEVEVLDLIKSRLLFEELPKDSVKPAQGALASFQKHLITKGPAIKGLDTTLACGSAITRETLIYKVFEWMKDAKATNANCNIVLLNYDELVPEFYRLSLKLNYPIHLSQGIKCVHFGFFAKIMTVLAGYVRSGNEAYIDKARAYLQHMDEDEKENAFRKKALSLLSDIKKSLESFSKLDLTLDVHDTLLRELKKARLSAKDLEMDGSGLWISDPSEVAGLDLENVAILGLETSNYPKKKKLDPILKLEEREEVIASTGAALNIEKLDPWDGLLERLIQKVSGSVFLGYGSHDLASGKLTVPSSFYNHVLGLLGQDVSIDNIYKLCNVAQSFLEDIPVKNEFYSLNSESTLASALDDHRRSLMSFEENELDYGTWDEIRMGLSASGLELFFNCPHKFHLKYHLKLEPMDLERGDDTSWLDVMQRGTFLHRCYELLLTPHLDKPDYANRIKTIDEAQIQKVIDLVQTEDDFKDANPAVAPHFKQLELIDLKENVQEFIDREQKRKDTEFYPLYVEKEFEFDLDIEGEKFSFKGFIDRVDTDGKGNYQIVDYKTGKTYFSEDLTNLFTVPYYGQSKVYLQHAIYTAALKDHLAKEKLPMKSIRAGYYFTSETGEWETYYHRESNMEKEFTLFLNLYLKEAQSKKYYKNHNACKFCDYKNYCKKEPADRAKRVSSEQITRISDFLKGPRSC